MWVAVVIAAAGLLYLAFPTYNYYFDGVAIALGVEGVGQGGSFAWLLHPHHLAYGPLVYAAYICLWKLGMGIRALLVMQLFSTAAAVGGLILFHRILRGLEVPPGPSIAGVAMLAACFNWWHSGTMPDMMMVDCLGLLAVFLLLVGVGKSLHPRAQVIAAGLVLGTGVLIHVTAALFFAPSLWLLWRSVERPSRALEAALFTIACGAVVAAAYLVVAPAILHLSARDALFWARGYLNVDPRTGYRVEYGSASPAEFLASLRVFVANLVGTRRNAGGAAALQLFFGAPIVCISVGGMVWAVARAPSERVRVAGPIFAWLTLHAAFFTWWNAGNLHFWLAALPFVCLLSVLAIWEFPARGRGALASLVLSIAACSTVIAGVAGPIRKEIQPETNRFLSVANEIAHRTGANDWIVISGVGEWEPLKVYLPYFAQRQVFTLDWQFAGPGEPHTEALARLRGRLDALSRTGKVYVASEAFSPEHDTHFAQVHGIGGTELRGALPIGKNSGAVSIVPGLELLPLHKS